MRRPRTFIWYRRELDTHKHLAMFCRTFLQACQLQRTWVVHAPSPKPIPVSALDDANLCNRIRQEYFSRPEIIALELVQAQIGGTSLLLGPRHSKALGLNQDALCRHFARTCVHLEWYLAIEHQPMARREKPQGLSFQLPTCRTNLTRKRSLLTVY